MEFQPGDVCEKDVIRTDEGKVIMGAHERASNAPQTNAVSLDYFIVTKSLTPTECPDVIDGKLKEGEVLVRIPNEAIEKMAFHYEFWMRRERQIFLEQEQKKEAEQPLEDIDLKLRNKFISLAYLNLCGDRNHLKSL